jgi:hypothetical protein
MQPAAVTSVCKASAAQQLGKDVGNEAKRIAQSARNIRQILEDVCTLYNATSERNKGAILSDFRAGLESTGHNANKYMTTLNQICKKGMKLLHADPGRNLAANTALAPAGMPEESNDLDDFVWDVTADALSKGMKDAAAARSLESLCVLQEDTTHVNEAAARSLDSSIHQVGCAIEVDSSTSSAVASSDSDHGGGRKPKPPAPMGAITALRMSKRQRSKQTATVADPDTGASDEESEISAAAAAAAAAADVVHSNITAAPKSDAARKPAVVRKPAAHHRQTSPAATEAIAAPKRCHIPDVRKFTCSIEVVMCLLDSMNGIEWNRGNNSAVRTSARTTLLCIFQSSTKPTSPAGLCFVQCGWGA